MTSDVSRLINRITDPPPNITSLIGIDPADYPPQFQTPWMWKSPVYRLSPSRNKNGNVSFRKTTPKFRLGKRVFDAHRATWLLLVGPIPTGQKLTSRITGAFDPNNVNPFYYELQSKQQLEPVDDEKSVINELLKLLTRNPSNTDLLELDFTPDEILKARDLYERGKRYESS